MTSEPRVARPLLVIGTRPEAIKMAPVVWECWRRADRLRPIVCWTGQHRELTQSALEYFGVGVDLDLNLMTADQSLVELTARCLTGLDETIAREAPDVVIAQGDTTTVAAAAIASFYRRVPFVHVEAGLRTGDLAAPWPEEWNRRVVSLSTSLHCAPTRRAAENLLAEGVPSNRVAVTGNPIVDALRWTIAREQSAESARSGKRPPIGDRRMVLITCHRRETWGAPLAGILEAIRGLATRFDDVRFVVPVHPNPRVRDVVHRHLTNSANVHLIEPAPYPDFVWLLSRAELILTDSGGVQEEAATLEKPTLVLRTVTERPECLEGGWVELIGVAPEAILERATRLLSERAARASSPSAEGPFGDGRAGVRIVERTLELLEAAP